jgi:HAD superfamily phosphoserine phosphatase-like hydrolase
MAAIADLDGTLISVSSEKELVLSLLGSRLISPRAFAGFLASYALHPVRTLRSGKGWNRSYLQGLPAERLEEHCRLLAKRLMDRARTGVASMLRSWSEEGTRVVLMSATLLPLAQELAPLCGAREVVASVPEKVNGRLTGRVAGPRPWGAAKLELAREVLAGLSVDPAEAAALGDSWSDRHILRLCGLPVAVCPDRRLRRLAAEEGWTLLDGRHTRWA